MFNNIYDIIPQESFYSVGRFLQSRTFLFGNRGSDELQDDKDTQSPSKPDDGGSAVENNNNNTLCILKLERNRLRLKKIIMLKTFLISAYSRQYIHQDYLVSADTIHTMHLKNKKYIARYDAICKNIRTVRTEQTAQTDRTD